jgi:hypothetical protein
MAVSLQAKKQVPTQMLPPSLLSSTCISNSLLRSSKAHSLRKRFSTAPLKRRGSLGVRASLMSLVWSEECEPMSQLTLVATTTTKQVKLTSNMALTSTQPSLKASTRDTSLAQNPKVLKKPATGRSSNAVHTRYRRLHLKT